MRARPLIAALCAMAAAVSLTHAAAITETFSTDPLARGWRSFGDPTLFRWNSTNQNLDVTWDSSKTNSYFWLPLNTIVSLADDFSFSFDLRMKDIAIGASTNKPYTFQVALGFLNMSNATATNFYRGAGTSSYGPRNLAEFDYFPDSGYGATFSPTVATTNRGILFSDNHPLTLTTGDLFHIALSFTASNRTLRTTVLRNGSPYGLGASNGIKDLVLTAAQDFRVDTLAIMSYSDAIQVGQPTFWGSILAHGAVDNLVATVPDPAVQNFSMTRSNGISMAKFLARTNFQYVLDRSADLITWTNASATNTGVSGALSLADTNASARAYYRLRAMRP